MTITEQIAQNIASKLSTQYKKEIIINLTNDTEISNEPFWEKYKDTCIWVYCNVTGEDFVSTSMFVLEEAETLLLKNNFYLNNTN